MTKKKNPSNKVLATPPQKKIKFATQKNKNKKWNKNEKIKSKKVKNSSINKNKFKKQQNLNKRFLCMWTMYM